MAIKMIFDPANKVQSPTMTLTNRGGKTIGSIIPKNINYIESMNSYNEFSFDVYKSLDGFECKHWNEIKDFKLIYCVEWDAYFEIYVEIDETDETIKHIQGRSLGEAELSQSKVYGLEVNTELDISRDDYEPTIIYSSKPENSLIHKLLEKTPNFEIGHVDISIAKLQRTFTFDNKTVYDAFQEVSKEVKCLVEFVSKKGDNGQIQRIINVYDLQPFCAECGCRNITTDANGDICAEYENTESAHQNYDGRNIKYGFGEDTSIFISTQNLAENITYSSDTDSVKNCFKLTAGDDLMTATVRSCSPSKSGYLWHFTEDTKADMSEKLRTAINDYQTYYNKYTTEFAEGDINYGAEWAILRAAYNEICEKYQGNKTEDEFVDYKSPEKFKNFSDIMKMYYNTIDLELYLRSGMMPKNNLKNNTASEEINKVQSSFSVSLKSLSSPSLYAINNAIESFLKTIIDSIFKIKLEHRSNTSTSWTGSVTLINGDDEVKKDISVILNDNFDSYTKQSVEAALIKEKVETPDVVNLFSTDGDFKNLVDFEQEIRKYALNHLIRIKDAGQACLNLMIEMGLSSGQSNSLWFEKWKNENKNGDLYVDLYLPYYSKVKLLESEIKTREDELRIVVGKYDASGNLISNGMMSYIENLSSKLQEELDLDSYISKKYSSSADALLKELVSFRREDSYQNDNFISDGLNNAQVFARALEFVSEAEKDIKAASIPVHTITSTLKNLLVMDAFKPLVQNFKVGNWIRAEIDNNIYRLRLIKYEISFDEIDNIIVEFSDVQAVKDSVADIQSILNQASTIASNYNNIKIVADGGKKAGEYVWEWVNDGLNLTKVKIVDDAENQNIYWDENGFLCREYSPVMDAYEDKQLKIINKGLYLTDDSWEHTRAAIGNFIYYDPSECVYKESYGVIADTLVGNLILSKEVGIYNENNSVTINKDGFSMTVKSSNNTNIFNIKKEVGSGEDISYEDLFFVDSNGNLNIKGNIVANSLTLGQGGSFDLGFNLSDYLTKSEASNQYVDSSGYALEKNQIWDAIKGITSDNTTSDLITKIGEFEDNAVFLAKPYGDIIHGYYYYGSFFKDSSYTTVLTPEYNKYYLDVSTRQYYYCNGSSYSVSSAPQGYAFAVSTDGLLTAANAVISGTIYATAGEFIGTVKSGLVNYSGHYNLEASNGTIKIGYRGTNADGSAKYAMTVNSDGSILFGDGVTLSWSSIPDAPTIPSGGNSSGGLGNTGNTSSGIDLELRDALGYGSNIIGSNYTISPYIYGSQLYIGNSDGTSYAQISNGILEAQGAIIKGKGTFDNGLYGQLVSNTTDKYNFKVENDCVYAGWNGSQYNLVISSTGQITLRGALSIEGLGSSEGTDSSVVYWEDINGIPDILKDTDNLVDIQGVVNIVNGNVNADIVSALAIKAKYVESGYIKSGNYTGIVYNSNSSSGSFIDLSDNGYFTLGGGALRFDDEGLIVNGEINAESGTIGGWSINQGLGFCLFTDLSAAHISPPIGDDDNERSESYFAYFICLTEDGGTSGEFGINYKGGVECTSIGCLGDICSNSSIIANGNMLCSKITSTEGMMINAKDSSTTYQGIYYSDGTAEIPLINVEKSKLYINIGCEARETYSERVNIRGATVDLGHADYTKNLYTSGQKIRIGFLNSTDIPNPKYPTSQIIFNAQSAVDNAGMGITSDRRFKQDISDFKEEHETLFNLLTPRTFKYIDGTSNRTHFGFIAQELEDAIVESGLTTSDVAAIMAVDTEEDGEKYYIRYQELVSLNTHMIQKCLKEIDNLKIENNSLKQQLEEIKQSI